MSTPAEIAAAVVAELNAADFGVEFTAERKNLPEVDLAGGGLAVVVSNVKDAPRRHSRFVLETTFTVDVAFARRLAADTLETDVDALDELVGLACRHFIALVRLPLVLTACVVEAERWACDFDRLRTSSEYVGLCRLQIKQDEAAAVRPPREE